MDKVEHISNFPTNCRIEQFFGKDYAEAVVHANKSRDFLFYYEQKHFGRLKSILACYEVKVEQDAYA